MTGYLKNDFQKRVKLLSSTKFIGGSSNLLYSIMDQYSTLNVVVSKLIFAVNKAFLDPLEKKNILRSGCIREPELCFLGRLLVIQTWFFFFPRNKFL